MTKPEKTLFEKDNIRITDRKVIFGDQSILLKDITMVDVQWTGPKPTGKIALGIIIFMLVLMFFTNSNGYGDYARIGVGILVLGLIVLALMMTREMFTVWVITEERVGEVFRSSNESSSQEIADVLNKARVGAISCPQGTRLDNDRTQSEYPKGSPPRKTK